MPGTLSEPIQTTESVTPAQAMPWRTMAQTAFSFTWFVGSLWLAAGRLNWIRGWIWVGVAVIGMMLVGVIVQRRNPGLLEQRTRWRRKDTKRFDKIFLAIYAPLIMIQPALAALDAARYHWTSIPFGFVYVGVVLFVLAAVMILWALVVNPFAESTVRIQTDRGHRVITSGPYRFVRHPMYVGMIAMYFGTPLILGSVWALGLSVVVAGLVIARTALEDSTLRRELAGYQEFAAGTRYRLLPGIW
jgi:protein-S-isoprenylcysteine O-methyltransferase Ste14